MVQVREILRQKLGLQRSNREIAAALRISPSTVSDVICAVRARGVDAAAADRMTDAELEALVHPPLLAAKPPRPEPDCTALQLELRRPGVTLALLHFEYLKASPDGLRYTAFCERYREWVKCSSLVMRQVHVGGDKLFVDYAGMKARIVDPTTGEVTEVELFVAVLGASNYTFAEATRTQQVPDFVASVARALTFIGGVPRAIVPDQLKSAVARACRYDPGVQRTTAELGRYYDTTILPARPKSPRDKAKVEAGVQVAERWLLARIRNETFTSLGALNARLAELTADLNGRVMRTYKVSRRELFERLDKPQLAPLPAVPFEASEWKKVALNIDYHVSFGRALLLRAARASPAQRVAVAARYDDDGGAVLWPRACRLASSQLRPRSFDQARAHAEQPPSARRVDALAHPRLGGEGRPICSRSLRRDPSRATPPRVGLSLVPRPVPAGEEVRPRATRRRMSSRASRRRSQLSLGADDPSAQPGSAAAPGRRGARSLGWHARERARARVLPLTVATTTHTNGKHINGET